MLVIVGSLIHSSGDGYRDGLRGVEPQTRDRCDGRDFLFLVPVLIIDSSSLMTCNAVDKKAPVFSAGFGCHTGLRVHPKCTGTFHFEV